MSLLYQNIPVLLDDRSGFTKAQVEQINIVARTARRAFTEKAKQKQKSQPLVEHLITKKYGRVLDLKDYLYTDRFSLNFVLSPVGFANNIWYPLFITEKTITSIELCGSNSENKVAASLTYLGHLDSKETSEGTEVYYVVDRAEDWPRDANNNMVNYSVYIGGSIG